MTNDHQSALKLNTTQIAWSTYGVPVLRALIDQIVRNYRCKNSQSNNRCKKLPNTYSTIYNPSFIL